MRWGVHLVWWHWGHSECWHSVVAWGAWGALATQCGGHGETWWTEPGGALPLTPAHLTLPRPCSKMHSSHPLPQEGAQLACWTPPHPYLVAQDSPSQGLPKPHTDRTVHTQVPLLMTPPPPPFPPPPLSAARCSPENGRRGSGLGSPTCEYTSPGRTVLGCG